MSGDSKKAGGWVDVEGNYYIFPLGADTSNHKRPYGWAAWLDEGHHMAWHCGLEDGVADCTYEDEDDAKRRVEDGLEGDGWELTE